jgi:hypothetical protein
MSIKFLCPQGIGDVTWALTKVESVRDALAPGEPIEVYLTCTKRDQLQDRALDYIRRFRFISSADMRLNYCIHNEPPYRKDGCYSYIEDGWYDFPDGRYCALMPNGPLEHGIRLEKWLPKYPIRWDIFSDFTIRPSEYAYADRLYKSLGPYCVFYPGPLAGNSVSGHNRNMLWKPTEWVMLGERIREELGLKIVVVGASYDLDYYNEFIVPNLNGSSRGWISVIGETSIGQLYAVTQRSKFLISYQAGVGIISAYLGVPTAMWWRPWGDSLSQDIFLSFREEMSYAWAPPAILDSGSYLPMIYGKHRVNEIMSEIQSRRWAE